jgi:hypothetical protein
MGQKFPDEWYDKLSHISKVKFCISLLKSVSGLYSDRSDLVDGVNTLKKWARNKASDVDCKKAYDEILGVDKKRSQDAIESAVLCALEAAFDEARSTEFTKEVHFWYDLQRGIELMYQRKVYDDTVERDPSKKDLNLELMLDAMDKLDSLESENRDFQAHKFWKARLAGDRRQNLLIERILLGANTPKD